MYRIEDPVHGSLCFCSESEIERHWQRLGSALLDRIELRVGVCPPQGIKSEGEEPSTCIRRRVEIAIKRQRERFLTNGIPCRRNSRIPAGKLRQLIGCSLSLLEYLEEEGRRRHLSGRGLHGVLRVARTIADLADRSDIEKGDLEEALEYRCGVDDSLNSMGIPL